MQEEHSQTECFFDQIAKIRQQQRQQSEESFNKAELYQNFYEDKINDFLDEFANIISEHQNYMAQKRQEIIELNELFLQVKQDQKMLKEALHINTETSQTNIKFIEENEQFLTSTNKQIKIREEQIKSFQTLKAQQGKTNKRMFYKKGLKTSIDKQKSQLCITIAKDDKLSKEKVQYYFKYNQAFNRLELIGQGSKQLTKLLGQYNCNRNIRQFEESLRYYTEQAAQNRSQN